MRIQSGADGRATNGEIEQTRHRKLQSFDVALNETRPAAHLLVHCERSCVLEVSSADLDYARKLFGFCCDGVVKFLNPRDEFVQLLCCGDVHRGRESVV